MTPSDIARDAFAAVLFFASLAALLIVVLA